MNVLFCAELADRGLSAWHTSNERSVGIVDTEKVCCLWYLDRFVFVFFCFFFE